MKYIEYISRTGFYSKFGFSHSVLLKDDKVLSYQQEHILGGWRFIIYPQREWFDNIGEITFKQDIKDFDIEQYNGIKRCGLVCFEAIHIICIENGVYLQRSSFRLKAIILRILILIFTHLGVFIFGYYGLTMSEQDYLQFKTELCQD